MAMSYYSYKLTALFLVPMICAMGTLYGAPEDSATSVIIEVSAESHIEGNGAAEPIPTEEASSQQTSEKAVQLGVTLGKPSADLYAQLPLLTRGGGFILKSIKTESSAEKAGLRPMDVIWKIDGQILINEGQLAVLLSLHKPGDMVEIDCFQGGIHQKISMKLYPSAGKSAVTYSERVNFSSPSGGNLDNEFPIHVVSYENRSVMIKDENGTATLKKDNDRKVLVITTSEGDELYRSDISGANEAGKWVTIPQAWRRKVPILKRSLEKTESLRGLPRVRRVPTRKSTRTTDSE